ncbi:MAG: helix-turn-helix domain containing protein, partial [Bacteroidetes bacterium]|nr:helix-turn-helix domain containing protein [Bacteroidota bacterium]
MIYEPKHTKIAEVWKRLSPESREKRLDKAKKRLEIVEALNGRPAGESERAAAIRLDITIERTTLLRWRKKYEEYGLDGLIDVRIGPNSPVPKEIHTVICTLRRADPSIAVKAIMSHLEEYYDFKTSGTTIKKVLRENGLNRRPGPEKGNSATGEQHLELGGMKFLEAAFVETNYMGALTQAIITHVEDLPRSEIPKEVDKSGRNELGQFLPEYNERYRKKLDDHVGPGFASVSEKRQDMNPDSFQISKTSEEVIERKLLGLAASPMIGSGRWDGMRMFRADSLLEEVCGYPYMPGTLDKFTRELKYAGVASTLWEVHARLWLALSSNWGNEKQAAICYVDGTTKPIWTRLFSQSTKVSQVGRVMPALEKVAFHTGYGVPLWMLTHSGGASLVKIVPDALNKLDEICGPSSVGRLVVIDAEANSIPFLKGLEQSKPCRTWATRLKEEWVKNKKIFNRTNYRPYRDGDRVRMGKADFNDPAGGTFRMKVVEVERRSSGKVTYLGASMMLDDREWKAADIADLYFDRWPAQEANFRAVNKATGFKKVHGYGKQFVDNISVVTELDKLALKSKNAEERLLRQQANEEDCKQRIIDEKRILGRKVRRQETVQGHVKAKLKPGKSITRSLQKLVEEQRVLSNEIAKKKDKLSKFQE